MSGKLLPAESEESNVPTGQRIYNMEQSGAGTNIGVAQSISFISSGEAGIQTGTIKNMNVSIQNISVVPPLITPQLKAQPKRVAADRSHYNLFVTSGVDWLKPDEAVFKVEHDRVLSEYMENSIKAEFSTLSD